MDTEIRDLRYRGCVRKRKTKDRITMYVNVPCEFHDEIQNLMDEPYTVDITLHPVYLKEKYTRTVE